MNYPLHGTIIFGARRESFVVVAADQGAAPRESDSPAPVSLLIQRKIVLHRDLPVAAAMGGLATISIGSFPTLAGEMLISDILQEVFDEFVPRSNHVLDDLIELIVLRLLPLTRSQGPFLTAKGYNPDCHVAVVLASYISGCGDLTCIRMDQEAYLRKYPDTLLIPTRLQENFRDIYCSASPEVNDKLMGKNLKSAGELIDHARTTVREGIERERSLYGGQNRECGGDVDVAIVDADGRKFVPCPSFSRSH
jgi:hypothetical protein